MRRRRLRHVTSTRGASLPADCPSANRRLLLVAPYSSYRAAPFIDAARDRGLEVFLLSGRSALHLPSGVPGAAFDHDDPLSALRVAREQHERSPFHGICATDDSVTELGARVAQELGLTGNDPAAAALTRNKLLARQRLRDAGIDPRPVVTLDAREMAVDPAELPGFPLVVKPLSLSASRGVIRVDNATGLRTALERIRRLLESEFPQPDYTLLAEPYVPGFEVAVEAVLFAGRLEVLAVFDKPEPLVGPYFEETYYTTPSRLPGASLQAVHRKVDEVCTALGLREGPVHAECRINETGVWPIEVAARSIGGKCARLLSIATGLTLEDIVIAHALGERPPVAPIDGGAGVLMVPVPASGVVRRVEGIGAARRVPGIEQVEIDVGTGQVLRAWPEGGGYPGFIFSRAQTPLEAELALRKASELITIVVAPLIA